MTTFRRFAALLWQSWRRGGQAMALALVLAGSMMSPMPAQAQTNTADILQNTISALPSCIKWQPTGVCFWLKCVFIKCKVQTSFRIRHYVPDAIVSTYHDPLKHPWGDLGRLVATASTGMGSAILQLPLDSSGSSSKHAEIYNSRDADMFGNPVGLIANMLASQSFSVPATIRYPSVSELASYPSTVPSILKSWGSVPGQFKDALDTAKAISDLPKLANEVSKVSSLVSAFGNIQTAWGKMGDLSSFGANFGQGLPQIPNLDFSSLADFVNNIGAGGFTSSSVFCPGSASLFGLHYQSMIDGFFWRGLIPLEMLYPSSWIPGMAEVSEGFPQTWGGIYPRINDLHQAQGAKGSAVLATRVLSIVSQSAQPHIYSRLNGPYSGFRMFETGGAPLWQRVYPNPNSSCGSFGANDSLGLTSWGDGNTTSEEGYIWNLWRRYECCQVKGQIFLGSIHW